MEPVSTSSFYTCPKDKINSKRVFCKSKKSKRQPCRGDLLYGSRCLSLPLHRDCLFRNDICRNSVTASVVTPLLQLSYLRCCNCRNSVAPIAVTLLRFQNLFIQKRKQGKIKKIEVFFLVVKIIFRNIADEVVKSTKNLECVIFGCNELPSIFSK